MSTKRAKFLIDRPIQVGLVARIVMHWFLFLVAAAICLPLVRAIVTRDFMTPLNERAATALVDATILFVVFLVLSPYLIYDTFRLTNRFAGPMYRLRKSISTIASGGPIRNLTFRKGDYWYEVAGEYNKMIARLQSQRASTPDHEQETVGV